VAFWQDALRTHIVHPLDAEDTMTEPRPPMLLCGGSKRYLKPSRIALTSFDIRGPASELSIQNLIEGPYEYDFSDPATGEETTGEETYWVVIKGRRPGIYNSWFVVINRYSLAC
jgi:hypothetical protein